MTTIRKERVIKLVSEAFTLGFMVSREGFNGECPSIFAKDGTQKAGGETMKSKPRISKNALAGELCGFRPDGMAIDMPWELGYVCPVCKKNSEALQWSEYRGFLWCEDCNLDIPSCLCVPDLKRATGVYLDCVRDAKEYGGTKP